jgi:RimJ/RimL family protein N-acetyltransferase
MTYSPIPASYRCLPYATLERNGFALRTVQPADIEPIRQWRNAQMNVLRQTTPISAEAQEAYFAETIWPSLSESRPANILLAFLENGSLIGYGGLVHIAWGDRRAEVSFLLTPKLAGDEPVYGARFAAFLGLIRELAFQGLGLHRLFTETYAFRTAHIAVLEQAGFRLEGRMRDHVVIDGQPIDSLLHGCLNDVD